jgi:stage V sporulation protein G
VSIVLDDCFIVNDIKIIQGRECLFISMPSRRKRNGEFKDVAHPLNNLTRSWIEDRIIAEYNVVVEGAERLPQTESRELGALAGQDGSPPSESTPESANETDEAFGDDREHSLDEVQEHHLSDSFWSVS